MSKIKTMIVAILVILSCASFVSASSVNMNLANENAVVSNSRTQYVVSISCPLGLVTTAFLSGAKYASTP